MPRQFSVSAQAAHGFIRLIVVVIDGQFLALANRAQTHIDNMALHNARHQIGLARMIHQLRARAPHAAVEGPVIVKDEQVGRIAAPLRLTRSDLLAAILHHLAIGRDVLDPHKHPSGESWTRRPARGNSNTWDQ